MERFTYHFTEQGWRAVRNNVAISDDFLSAAVEQAVPLKLIPKQCGAVVHFQYLGRWAVACKPEGSWELQGFLIEAEKYEAIAFDPYLLLAREGILGRVLTVDSSPRLWPKRGVSVPVAIDVAAGGSGYLRIAHGLFLSVDIDDRSQNYSSILPPGKETRSLSHFVADNAGVVTASLAGLFEQSNPAMDRMTSTVLGEIRECKRRLDEHDQAIAAAKTTQSAPSPPGETLRENSLNEAKQQLATLSEAVSKVQGQVNITASPANRRSFAGTLTAMLACAGLFAAYQFLILPKLTWSPFANADALEELATQLDTESGKVASIERHIQTVVQNETQPTNDEKFVLSTLTDALGPAANGDTPEQHREKTKKVLGWLGSSLKDHDLEGLGKHWASMAVLPTEVKHLRDGQPKPNERLVLTELTEAFGLGAAGQDEHARLYAANRMKNLVRGQLTEDEVLVVSKLTHAVGVTGEQELREQQRAVAAKRLETLGDSLTDERVSQLKQLFQTVGTLMQMLKTLKDAQLPADDRILLDNLKSLLGVKYRNENERQAQLQSAIESLKRLGVLINEKNAAQAQTQQAIVNQILYFSGVTHDFAIDRESESADAIRNAKALGRKLRALGQ
jgi:hypothetical protein